VNIISEIDRLSDASSKRYGRLYNWRNHPDPFWHYGIGLSNFHMFDTGQGLRPFKKEDARPVIGIDHIAFSPEKTIKRLRHSLTVFAGWKYNFLGWNCEHFARLIATDRPRCYQSASLWLLCDMTSEGDHKTARRILAEHLAAVDASLLYR
jgi:hypothetical protein